MEENIVFKDNNGIKYIQFKKLLEYGIKHCYTLKGDELDFSTESKYEKSSYEKICKALELGNSKIFKTPRQIHSDIVKCVNENTVIADSEGFDGFITDRKNVALAARNADCILFLFYDPVKKVIANVHSRLERNISKNSRKNSS